MSKTIIGLLCAVSTLAVAPAVASPLCLKHQRFELKQDEVSWSMALKPGADCIQGLRWSYMQIYEVKIVQPPKFGKLVVVGSGFRYFADPERGENPDHFTIAVDGKNRHDVGSSTIQVTVEPPAGDAAKIKLAEIPSS